LLPAPALAQGIDLSWKDCVGSGFEASNQTFACSGAANQTYNLIFQFKVPQDIDNFIGAAAYVDYLNVSGAPLSPFWHFEAGGCNNSGSIKGIAMFDDIQLLPNCAAGFADPWDGDGSGGFEGIAAYGVDFHRPGNGYFILGDARGQAIPLVAGRNYYAFHLAFNNRNRATCAGCSEPGIVRFSKLTLESNDGSPPVDLTTTDKFASCVTVNGAPIEGCGTATTTTLAADPNPAKLGDQVTLTATVQTLVPPVGTVDFLEGTTLLGTAPVVNATAVLVRGFAAGSHPLTATYHGDPGHLASTSEVESLFVGSAPVVSVSDAEVIEPSTGTVHLEFTVSLSSPSTETVTVSYATADSTALSASDYVARNAAVSFPPDSTSIRVVVQVRADAPHERDEYLKLILSNPTIAVLGDGIGVGTIHDVTPCIQETSTGLAVSPNPAKSGDRVTLTATLSAVDTIAGSVQFRDGPTSLGTAPIVNDVATLAATFSEGSHTITASYLGDDCHPGSDSPPVVLVVGTAPVLSIADTTVL
jgi:hypothetical protein